MTWRKFLHHMRLIAGALALAFVVATAMPAAAQQPSSVNPNADAVKEQQLLQQLKVIRGRGTIPDVKSYTLEHPAGREWREYPHRHAEMDRRHRHLSACWRCSPIYYSWHGTMRIEEGRSGRTIMRFNVFERFVHWLTAVTFVILGDHRPQHHLRPQPDPAMAGGVGVQRMVGMGEILA